jgi:hypothetical protein
MSTEIDILLLDVKRMRLVESSSSARYLALSYVWGEVLQYKTTVQYLDTLKFDNSLVEFKHRIPQVIQDAILLVDSLGERYLWVDALCIIHDDEYQKHHQISQMASIYDQAVMTIVALAGENATVGLPGLRPGSRPKRGVELVPGVSFCPRTRKLSDIISNSKYNTRAWTYQERLLSRRCLYFTEEQVYFQCDSCVCCEDRNEPSPVTFHQVSSLKASAQTMFAAQNIFLFRAFEHYGRLVVDYSRKSLSFQSDIISAFMGITQHLEVQCGWKFVAGLPIHLIDLSLLWAPSAASPQLHTEHKPRAEFPTWSWSGWIGAVDYDLLPSRALKSMIEDFYIEDDICSYKIEGRLKLHTQHSKIEQNKAVSSAFETAKTSPGEKARILHFKASSTSATKFRFQKANCRYYVPDSRMTMDLNYQSTTLILDPEGHSCGMLFGIDEAAVLKSLASDVEFILLSAIPKSSYEVPRTLKYAELEIEQPGLRPDGTGRSGHFEGGIFDDGVYGTTLIGGSASRWSALNVLLVSRQGESVVRVALGQIHATAWQRAGPTEKRFKLI